VAQTVMLALPREGGYTLPDLDTVATPRRFRPAHLTGQWLRCEASTVLESRLLAPIEKNQTLYVRCAAFKWYHAWSGSPLIHRRFASPVGPTDRASDMA
jgi:hypothetical protein